MNAEAIGRKLKTLRGSRSAAVVAASVGISASALGMYETGRRIPRDEIKVKLAEYYGTSIEDIFFKDE